MDGYVTISTELDTKDFDAQIDYVQSQLDDIEDKLNVFDIFIHLISYEIQKFLIADMP